MASACPPVARAVARRMASLAGIWAGLTALLLAAGEIVIHSAAVTHFDRHLTLALAGARIPALNSAMKAVTWLGSWVAVVAGAAVIALLVLARRLPVLALIVAVFAWAGETGGVQIGKHLLRRDRPPAPLHVVHATGWSFPSGHAAAACLVFPVLAWCLATLVRRRLVSVLGWLAAGLAVAATAFSRVELGVHWTTDVIASVIFVISWLTVIAISLRGPLRQPVPIATSERATSERATGIGPA